jgi:probable H4MPT-linked C1 transfer pathway protein
LLTSDAHGAGPLMTSMLGWDIGGANLKAARVENGVVVAAAQRPCAPHLGLGQVEAALRDMSARLGAADRHAVTMTAELSDAFPDRASGVVSIAAIFAREVAAEALYYAGARGFVAKDDVAEAARAVASANWRASAEWVAQRCAEALFVDMGSTTTDIVPIIAGRVAARGEDDASRLRNGEFVYTGLLRGDPGAGLALAPVDGRWVPLVDESFATTADVHRLLGVLPDAADTLPTVDGRPKSLDATRARLARLVGRDAADGSAGQWEALAAFFARAQLRRLEDAIALIASRTPAVARSPLIGAGVGRELLSAWARREGRAFRDFAEFIPTAPDAQRAAADCAPACAVALLAAAQT